MTTLAHIDTSAGTSMVEREVDMSSVTMEEKDECSHPSLNLAQLVSTIRRELGKDAGMPLKKRDALQQAMIDFDSSFGDWKRFALFDADKLYTRNLVATDNETFTLLMLCWNPHKGSPIHDHPCDGCWMRVVQNTVNEKQYKVNPTNPKEFVETKETDFVEGQCAFIDDGVGFHKVSNITDTPSVTLHLYAPPYQSCRAWMDPSAVEKVARPVVTFYSINGKKVEYESPTP